MNRHDITEWLRTNWVVCACLAAIAAVVIGLSAIVLQVDHEMENRPLTYEHVGEVDGAKIYLVRCSRHWFFMSVKGDSVAMTNAR